MSLDQVPVWHLVVLFGAVLVGALVQGVVGLGIGLVVTPVTALLDPGLVPGAPLVLAAVYPLLTLTRDARHVDWGGLVWALPTRLLGTGVGVGVVAWASDRQIGVVVGAMVLVAVALTVRTVAVPVSRPTLMGAGFVSGVTGTATSIGGPPLALLYQHRPPEQVRGTLGVYFVLGAAMSIALLAPGGSFSRIHLEVAGMMLPALLLGFLASRVAVRRVPAGRVRTGTLIVCSLSATALLVRSLVG